MFILSTLGPLHYSRGHGLTVSIDELPVTRELRCGQPLRQRLGLAVSDISVCLNQSDYFPSPSIQRRQQFLLSDLSLHRAWWESTSTTDVPGEFR